MKRSESYTFEDYRNGTPPRVFGSETEYTYNGTFTENLHMDYGYYWGGLVDPLSKHVDTHHLVSPGRDKCTSAIVTTGGELYLDGAALEYATPECSTPSELVLHERAGETIAYNAIKRLATHYDFDEVRLYKRSGYANVPDKNDPCRSLIKENSIGNHENYMSINEFSDDKHPNNEYGYVPAGRHMASYLVLRKLIDGIGMADENHYSITQRPRAVDYLHFTSHVTQHGEKRAFTQQKDRLEIRTGEANKSDWATEFKFGLTSLVIRLIEHGVFPPHLELVDPNQAVQDLARDPLAEVLLVSGNSQKGIDTLKEIVDAAIELCVLSPDWPDYEQKAANNFYTFYDDLHMISLPDDDVTALADRIDWAGRYKYFVSRGGTYATINTRNLAIVRDDLKWDEISDREISRRYFTKFGHTALHATIPNVPNTRAKARIEITGKLEKSDDLAGVDWQRVSSNHGVHYNFDNPLSQAVTITHSNNMRTPPKESSE